MNEFLEIIFIIHWFLVNYVFDSLYNVKQKQVKILQKPPKNLDAIIIARY